MLYVATTFKSSVPPSGITIAPGAISPVRRGGDSLRPSSFLTRPPVGETVWACLMLLSGHCEGVKRLKHSHNSFERPFVIAKEVRRGGPTEAI